MEIICVVYVYIYMYIYIYICISTYGQQNGHGPRRETDISSYCVVLLLIACCPAGKGVEILQTTNLGGPTHQGA